MTTEIPIPLAEKITIAAGLLIWAAIAWRALRGLIQSSKIARAEVELQRQRGKPVTFQIHVRGAGGGGGGGKVSVPPIETFRGGAAGSAPGAGWAFPAVPRGTKAARKKKKRGRK